MEFKGFEEKAETPELGGYFGDLVLIIKPNLAAEKRKRNQKYIKTTYDRDTKKEVMFYDLPEMNKDFLPLLADHIIGWRNLTENGEEIKFTESLRNHFFFNLKDEKTVHELELQKPKEKPEDKDETEIRIATLEEYVNHFMNRIENFTKN
jgi:hypothetical protein